MIYAGRRCILNGISNFETKREGGESDMTTKNQEEEEGIYWGEEKDSERLQHIGCCLRLWLMELV